MQPDGATASELARLLEAHPSSVIEALQRMPDVYIDRWQQNGKSKYAAVWCAVVVPEDCPHPTKETNVKHRADRSDRSPVPLAKD